MELKTMWKDPIAQLQSCVQGLACKVGTVKELEQMAKVNPTKELTLENLHKDMQLGASVVKDEYSWLCRTLADALNAIGAIELEKVKTAAGQVS